MTEDGRRKSKKIKLEVRSEKKYDVRSTMLEVTANKAYHRKKWQRN